MATDKKLLNFRCPVDLIAAIDQLGQQRYPAINENGCDRSKTLLDIITAGIQSLTDGSIVIPITSDVKQKSVLQSDIDIEAIKAELRDQLLTEVDQRINASIQPIRGELLEKLTIINADNEALRQQISVLQSDNEVLHNQIEALSNTPERTLGNLLNQEVVEPETILSNIPGIAPDEVTAISVEVGDAIAPLPQQPVPEVVPEVVEAEEPEQPEAVQVVPFDDAVTILDDSEKVDAGESSATTGDELVTDEPEAVEAIASPQEENLNPQTITPNLKPHNQEQLAKRFGCASSTVYRARQKKSESEFISWSREKDSDKIGWRFDEKEEMFYPVF
ncbi:MAG: hypothetical protein WBB28_15815 [Crinalium sp.]